MKIGIYISELLFEHEEVILPGLGAFYTKYNPARFVPEIQKVESPSKTVAFNPDKQEGASPLVEHLAKKETMDAGQVKKYLSDFVAEAWQVLESGKKFELEKLGVFSLGPDKNLVFEPDTSVNYLSDAVGMSPVKQPEKSAKTGKEGEPAAVPAAAPLMAPREKEHLPKPEEDRHEKTALPPALKWVAYTVVPLLVIIIILALNFNFFFGENGLFKSSKPDTEARITEPAAEPSPETAAATTPEGGGSQTAQEDETAQESETGMQQSPDTETSLTTQAADPATQPPQPESGRPVYFIVVGSFPDEAVAEELALRLREEGAPLASVFMETGFGYHRVAYGYYYNLQEAEALLDSVRENVTGEAYILHR